MFQAQGYYRSGYGCASQNLRLQIPGIAMSFPEIRNFHPATINVRFEPKIIVAGFDHRTPPLRWAEGAAQGEVFDLVRVQLLFPDIETRIGALIYVAHWSGLLNDPHMTRVRCREVR